MGRWRWLWLPGVFPDRDTARWAASAKTQKTRARIRRWSRAENISMLVTLFGVVLLAIAPFATVALLIVLGMAGIERTDIYWWIWGSSAGLSIGGAIAGTISSEQLDKARYADGHESIGTVDRVIEHPGSGDDQTWYQVDISAEQQRGAVLRRTLHWPDDGNDPHRLIGGPIRFRHNTLDPDDLRDYGYEGIPGADGRRGLS
ncbi:hypothetical protein [Microbacterium sp. NPDC056234]|uniref:hypothetical protein n=1 Tax=Microbacterium sp. NPDC056234 TaxID=3345757 RepID=UPI0035E03958